MKNGSQVPDFGPYPDKDWPDPDKGQAAMISRLDGIRTGGFDMPILLYDQSADPAETKNVADQHPEIAIKISNYLKAARTESVDWSPIW